MVITMIRIMVIKNKLLMSLRFVINEFYCNNKYVYIFMSLTQEHTIFISLQTETKSDFFLIENVHVELVEILLCTVNIFMNNLK